jgi:hypothetical protein
MVEWKSSLSASIALHDRHAFLFFVYWEGSKNLQARCFGLDLIGLLLAKGLEPVASQIEESLCFWLR